MATMQAYSEFKPTPWDGAGRFLHDKQDWLVVPVGRNRDSSSSERRRFDRLESALARVDAASESHEIHRFGHWACGWFEIAIVKPGSVSERAAKRFRQRREEC